MIQGFKKQRNLAGAIAPIAAGWLFGKAADKVGAAIDAIPEKEEKENDLWKKVLLAGGAALGLAGIYYLVTRNPSVKQAAQKGVVEAVEEVADQAEAYQQRRRAAEGLSEEKQPSILEQGAVTAASLPPEIRNSLPPGLANSNADIRNIQASEIAEELADVFYYTLLMANDLDIDILKAFNKKMLQNSKKYPVKKAKGKHTKYNKL